MKIYPYQTPEGIIELVEKREYDKLSLLAHELATLRAEDMARDSVKMIKGPHSPHGPYRLMSITPKGLAELDRDEAKHGTRFVPLSLISAVDEN